MKLLRLPALLCVGSLAFAAAQAGAVDLLPTFATVKASHHSSDALLLDRNGIALADRRFDTQARRLDWVTLDSLPETMREALLVAEDKRFFEHEGVDWRAFAGAVWQNLWGTRRGASTLTMQLAGLLEPTLALPAQGRERRSLQQKWDQGLAAMELEKHWSKPQILEAYLNLAPFRGDLQGVSAASEILFGLPTTQLTRREAVIIAALLRGPNARSSLVAHRACTLASKLGSAKLCPEITRLAIARLDAPRNQPRYTLTPQLGRRLLNAAGQRVYSLLDAKLQQSLLDTLPPAEASAVILDNVSGAVLAYFGGPAGSEQDGVIQARTLAGWWWPHAAALAIERGRLSAASLLQEHAWPQSNLPSPYASNAPLLPHSEQQSLRSLRTVMQTQHAESLHQLALLTEQEGLADRLLALGLSPPPGISLPDARGDVSLLQLAGAWRTLAAGGNFVAPRILPNDNGFRSLSGPEGGFITLDMLSRKTAQGWQAQWISEGPGGSVAVVGSTDRLTLALATNPGGRQTALRLWQAVLASISLLPSAPPSPPPGVESALVVFDPPVEPVRREWLQAGDAGRDGYRRLTPP